METEIRYILKKDLVTESCCTSDAPVTVKMYVEPPCCGNCKHWELYETNKICNKISYVALYFEYSKEPVMFTPPNTFSCGLHNYKENK